MTATANPPIPLVIPR